MELKRRLQAKIFDCKGKDITNIIDYDPLLEDYTNVCYTLKSHVDFEINNSNIKSLSDLFDESTFRPYTIQSSLNSDFLNTGMYRYVAYQIFRYLKFSLKIILTRFVSLYGTEYYDEKFYKDDNFSFIDLRYGDILKSLIEKFSCLHEYSNRKSFKDEIGYTIPELSALIEGEGKDEKEEIELEIYYEEYYDLLIEKLGHISMESDDIIFTYDLNFKEKNSIVISLNTTYGNQTKEYKDADKFKLVITLEDED